ncbi:Fc.00g107240.m01.CDS01 [Cosmosporella sp. VM-42]
MKIALDLLLSSLVIAGSIDLANAQESYTCNADNGKTIVKAGKKYELKCAQGIRGLPFKSEPATSIASCAEKCATNAECLHITFNEKTSMCEFKKAGDVFDYTKNLIATWYFLENVVTPPPVDNTGTGNQNQVPVDNTQQPITDGGNTSTPDPNNQASYACGTDDRKLYTTGGKTYELRCGMGHRLGHWISGPGTSLKDCADQCARNPDCTSCDFDGTTCYLKKAPTELAPWAGGHAWYPLQCPRPQATVAKKNPEVTKELTCPQNDGKIYEGSDGTWFYLQCCTDTDGASLLGVETATSHTACAEKCVADKKCKSVTFADGGDGTQPNCKLYGHGQFSTTKLEGAHHLFVTDPPTEEPKVSEAKLCSTECPAAHGQLFVSATGENFQMSCDKRHGTTYLKIDRRPTFEACMGACAAMPACDSADYEPRTKKCFYGNNHNQPAIDAKAFMSAHSLGCSGACAGCKKGCDKDSQTPLPADAAGCDADHGKIITSGGEDFRLQCRHCYRSVDRWNVPAAKSMAECAKLCAEDTRCHGANWMGPTTGCSHHPARDAASGTAPTFWRDATCDALLPQSRSLPDFETTQYDNPEKTARDW